MSQPAYYIGEKWHDFTVLKGCFGDSRIMPTDIDGMVERNGHFLVIEFKPDGKSITTGQKIMLRRLSKLNEFTVLVIWHEPCAVHEFKVPVAMQQFPDVTIEETDIDGVRSVVKLWYQMADNQKV